MSAPNLAQNEQPLDGVSCGCSRGRLVGLYPCRISSPPRVKGPSSINTFLRRRDRYLWRATLSPKKDQFNRMFRFGTSETPLSLLSMAFSQDGGITCPTPTTWGGGEVGQARRMSI